jgi:hypothetical protein
MDQLVSPLAHEIVAFMIAGILIAFMIFSNVPV